MPVTPLRPHDPRSLGDYRLTGLIGEGGMGSVFLARDRAGRFVAVKVIKPGYAAVDEFRSRFRNEVARARAVPPFCTAAVLDADPDHPTPYLVVEYVDGPDLTEVVAENGPLTGGALHSVAVGVATALVAIHGAGVVHRDLKPDNVLFALGSPKVIDFGIARAVWSTSEHTGTDQLVGTVSYLAPERLDGPAELQVTPAVDIFAWGAVITYAGTGRTPFGGDSPTATAARILAGEPWLEGLSGDLRDIVRRTLSKDPAQRPTAEELLALLLAGSPAATAATAGAAVGGAATGEAVVDGAATGEAPERGRGWVRPAVAGVLVLLAAGAGVGTWLGGRTPSQPADLTPIAGPSAAYPSSSVGAPPVSRPSTSATASPSPPVPVTVPASATPSRTRVSAMPKPKPTTSPTVRATTATQSGPISAYSACAAGGTVRFAATFAGGFDWKHVLIDADSDTATGYDGAGALGADYMIENEYLYESTGSEWSWEEVTGVEPLVSQTGGTVRWQVRSSAIDSAGAGTHIVFNGAGDNSDTSTPVVTVTAC